MSVYRPQPESEYFFEEGCYILELLNDPADPDVSIAHARVPAGGVTQWHHLSGITERYVILEGSGEVWLGEETPQEVRAGDVILIPPGLRQRIGNTGDGDLEFLAICSPRFQPEQYAEG